jgi:peptidyl-prolyl cis-trans isomerase-like 2
VSDLALYSQSLTLRGTDKLYITHSEWASEDAYAASAGSGVSKAKVAGVDSTFRRLPFNYCALSLQPFSQPVCTLSGTTFDHENILRWLTKNHTNPVDGAPLKAGDLIKLNFAKNEDGEYIDPVTYKVFTDNTHIIALKNTGNVFAFDTIDRLNIKAKNWHDLVSNDGFGRADMITLQDPQNVNSRNLSTFKYLKSGNGVNDEKEPSEDQTPSSDASGKAAKIAMAKEAVARARLGREKAADRQTVKYSSGKTQDSSLSVPNSAGPRRTGESFKDAQHTTGKAAASFTSTGLTPHTAADRAILSNEEFMLKPKRVKNKGYVRLTTSQGDLDVELLPENAPKAVWNFIKLAKKGYYDGLLFHRNIRNFMIQGGDPTGTGRGGTSIWGKNFADEFEGPMTHDARGILSMANKGKNTNSSQFFIIYRPAKHLDRKHTIFGRAVGDLSTLDRLEAVETDDKDRPIEPAKLLSIEVLLDPFDQFLEDRAQKEIMETQKEAIRKSGGTEDDKVTWTGKRVRRDGEVVQEKTEVGKYLSEAVVSDNQGGSKDLIEDLEPEEPVKKKAKSHGFGNFDNW